MISYEKALKIILKLKSVLNVERVSLNNALGRVLAEDICSDINMPPFNKAAMDGYACRRKDLQKKVLTIVEEIPAGSFPKKVITNGCCARIFTGAPVPRGADCVVMQEQTERIGNHVRILSEETAENICYKGEDIKKGGIVLKKGEIISPPHIAVLASVGVVKPLVYKIPAVVVFATGNELVEPAKKPLMAQIRNSNAYQLCAQLTKMCVLPFYGGILPDDEKKIKNAVAGAIKKYDVIIMSGGVSEGDYDFVPRILKEVGFTVLFDSVAIQPGRPTLFARKNGVYCFGLPGNPVSTYVIFEILVKPFLYGLMGHSFRPLVVCAQLAQEVSRKKTTRAANIPVRYLSPAEIVPVEYHGSAHIHAVTKADGIITIPEGKKGFKKGEIVDVRLF